MTNKPVSGLAMVERQLAASHELLVPINAASAAVQGTTTLYIAVYQMVDATDEGGHYRLLFRALEGTVNEV